MHDYGEQDLALEHNNIEKPNFPSARKVHNKISNVSPKDSIENNIKLGSSMWVFQNGQIFIIIIL
jgi:hypothetical protein